MKRLSASLSILLLTLLTMPVFASMQWYNSSGTELGILSQGQCGSNVTCTVSSGKLLVTTGSTSNLTGDGAHTISGYLKKQVTATATTITAAQCGSTFINAGAIAINLPEASAVLGCRLTFITANAANFDINPDDADQILILTNAAGDSIRNATLGNSVTLEAISASQWAPVGKEQGTWTDIN